ncbi:ferredoxin reductase [Williamsia sp. 1138]|uniref:ferredoxin reductase n=1 Tax=Williamsia sp. 1138 TaxID=1903117 RepID=UPI00248C6269|nr:ferredoxin reductase [Williamsia sp. 1138]
MNGWRPATVVAASMETPTARTLHLRVPERGSVLPGQHIDIRLTAEDGYQAVRSYSVAAAGGDDLLETTIEELADGEVSPYLINDLEVGDQVEIRGPIGRWFTWHASDPAPVQLIAGGSGVVPLMSMIRARESSGSKAPFRLLYSLRTPETRYYAAELDRLEDTHRLQVDYLYTRQAPPGSSRPAGRPDAAEFAERVIPLAEKPEIRVCGPTAFVEQYAQWLVDLGYPTATIRTERFGG